MEKTAEIFTTRSKQQYWSETAYFGKLVVNYRFGFNGQEKDDEITGVTGSHYTTHFRALDSRIGRWWSVDPKSSQLPWQSPYVTMGNNPIRMVDPDGDVETVFITGESAVDATDQLNSSTSLTITRDKKTGQLTAEGKAKNKYDKILLEAINSNEVEVRIETTNELTIGEFHGSTYSNEPDEIISNNKPFQTTSIDNEKVVASQKVNPTATYYLDFYTNSDIGTTMLHETTEAYEGGKIGLFLKRGIEKAWRSVNTFTGEEKTSPDYSIYEKADSRAAPQPSMNSATRSKVINRTKEIQEKE